MSRPVVVVGDVMVDVVARLAGPLAAGSDTPARIALRGGGAGANVAAWLARAGARRVRCRARRRRRGGRGARWPRSPRTASTSRVAVDPSAPTGTCVVLVAPDGERSMLPDRGANAALAPAPLPDLRRGAPAPVRLRAAATRARGRRRSTRSPSARRPG